MLAGRLMALIQLNGSIEAHLGFRHDRIPLVACFSTVASGATLT